MIIKAKKAKIDGNELEGVIDLSISIGNSASPSTASITFVGDLAQSVASSLTSSSLLEVGGIKFYGDEYSVSTSDGQGGLTSTLEMIDQSFDILDRYYVELKISNHGVPQSSGFGDYLFLGEEYYSFSERNYVWVHSLKTWEVNEHIAVANSTLHRNEYMSLYNSYKDVYISYQRALKNIESFQGRAGGNRSSSCADQEVEPADSLLLPGGEFSGHTQKLLNFPSMTNPYTTKGEIFYRGSDVPRNPFGSSNLFNATGSLRSVISSIAGQVGASWYWDCTKNHITGNGGVMEAPDATNAEPYPPKGHAYTTGMTRANSFAEGLIYKRYLEGEEADPASNEWIQSSSGINGSVFEDALEAFPSVQQPGSKQLANRALLYLELGEEMYKALWIAIEGQSGLSGSWNKLEQKIISSSAYKGNSKMADIIDGQISEDRDGQTSSSSAGDYELKQYSKTDWDTHLAEIREASLYMSIWRACGPSGDTWSGGTLDSDDRMSSRFPYNEYSKGVDPSLYERFRLDRSGNVIPGSYEYYPVVNEVVGYENMCFIKGSASIFYKDSLIKNVTHGQIFSLIEGDSACSDTEKLDGPLADYINTPYAIIANNSTWSYNFPACLMEQLQEWGRDAVIDFSTAIGPMELGLSPSSYELFDDNGMVAVKKLDFLPGGYSPGGEWDKILEDYTSLIKSDRVTVRNHIKLNGQGYPNDGKYSESMSTRLCSSGRGKANWAIQSIETGAEVNTSTIDQVRSFGNAQCVDKTPFISYTLFGEWEQLDDIADLDSISINYGSSGISTNYSRSYRKSVSPSALLVSGKKSSGMSASINLGPSLHRLSTKFKNMAFSRQAPSARGGGPGRRAKS